MKDIRQQKIGELSRDITAKKDALIIEAIGHGCWDFEDLQQRLSCVVHEGVETYYMDGIPIIEFYPYVPERCDFMNVWGYNFEQTVEYKINYRRFR